MIREEEKPWDALSNFRRGGVAYEDDNVCVCDAPLRRKFAVCVAHQVV